MLKQARFKNFTTLPNETLVFAPGLNVIVAENGCGKTHLLKAIYALLSVNTGGDLSKSSLQKAYADKLVGVFRQRVWVVWSSAAKAVSAVKWR
jgi:recombinational DNA repair ATPase RecF